MKAGRILEDLSVDLDRGLADVVERLQQGAPLNEADPKTFFGLGSKGYTD